MENWLEKVTLYDLLGYLVPGCVFMMLLLAGLGEETVQEYLVQWKDNKGILYGAFLLVSYLVGILLSEIMHWIYEKLLRNSIKIEEMLSLAQLTDALINSGNKEQRSEIERKIKEDFNKYYMHYIYGIIQKSDDCRRIHNYASAYVLYKNVSGALGVGAVIMLRTPNDVLLVICLLAGIIFAVRGKRFLEKKEKYAVVWFVEKYSEECEV